MSKHSPVQPCVVRGPVSFVTKSRYRELLKLAGQKKALPTVRCFDDVHERQSADAGCSQEPDFKSYLEEDDQNDQ